ncbi:hypothetical protein CHS0354_003414 [Potamilus streckersoni]|uniref:Uncharacterized protein n=1 Tax=Potamilus streckersoni TaxID=2493646 RepID=A0AAE0SPQ9_9BIVA|nr:hypothetical protein CHS0354_003414 [Potamilus streckersoni]
MAYFRMHLKTFIISSIIFLLYSVVLATERCPDGAFQWFECQPGRTRCPRTYYCHHANDKTREGICCLGGECRTGSLYEGRTCSNDKKCSHGFYCNRMPFSNIGFCCSL